MTVKRPTLEQMSEVVESLGMTMTKERVGEFISLMDGSFAAYDIVDQMADRFRSSNIRAHPDIGQVLRRIRSTPGT